jgi:hypothetical protein
LLVEGVTDVITTQQFLRKLQLDHQTVIIPLGGNTLINGHRERELAELKRLSKNVFVLIDSEKQAADEKLSEKRTQFVSICKGLEFDLCVLEQGRAIENYFPDRAVKQALGNSYSSLAPFQALKDLQNGWSKSDNWRIALETNIEEIRNTDFGQFLHRLAAS